MHAHNNSSPQTHRFRPLQGIRVLSLALNLPGPAALMRCQQMGAFCTKLEPAAITGQASADPMQTYCADAYTQLHAQIHTLKADLKTEQGQRLLQAQLAQSDVLLTSFRPGALRKLGLDWLQLQSHYPRLCMVRIFGSTSPAAIDHPGHDLTYQAAAGLVDDGHMPASLFADMAGALMASEAVLQVLLMREQSRMGHCLDVGLEQAAHWLAMPRQWGLTQPEGVVGGAHAGYKTYACADGWVAVAALEPHFAQRLCQAIGMDPGDISASLKHMREERTHALISTYLEQRTCAEISAMAAQSDIPLQVIPSKYK